MENAVLQKDPKEMEVYKSKVLAHKRYKKTLNLKLSKYQQNDLVKLTAAIQEPTASTYQFKFNYTNDLFQNFENAFLHKDEEAKMRTQLQKFVRGEQYFQRRKDLLIFEAAMAIKIKAKYPNIDMEQAQEVYKKTIQKHVFEQSDFKNPIDLFLFNVLSTLNFTSFKLPLNNFNSAISF